METSFDAALGARIRQARRAAKLSMKTLAGRLGISSHQMYKYERGINRVCSERLVNIAAALDVSAAELLGEGSGLQQGGPDDLAMVYA